MTKAKRITASIVGLLFVALVLSGLYWIASTLWSVVRSLNTEVTVALLTGVTTVLVATVTVMLGRYLERKRDHEAAYRERKTQIYDEFLKEIFDQIFHEQATEQAAQSNDRLVAVLREWQRKMIIWGGQDVFKAYIEWMQRLKAGNPDASTIFMTEDFFRAIRKDLGHTNSKLPRGMFVHLFLRESDLFLAAAKMNPKITLTELSELEKKQSNN